MMNMESLPKTLAQGLRLQKTFKMAWRIYHLVAHHLFRLWLITRRRDLTLLKLRLLF